MSNSFHVTEKLGFETGTKDRIDRQNHLIKQVKLLGLNSRNNATYQWDTVSKKAHLYEGVKVFLHHGTKDTSFPFGKVQNVQTKADGFYGDIKYNPHLPVTEGLLWYVDNAPETIGMSPDHFCRATLGQNGHKVYTDIISVNSVDFVSDPATTKGVFESMNPDGTLTTMSPESGASGEGNDPSEAFKAQLGELLASGAKTLPHDKFREITKHMLNAHAALEADEVEDSKGNDARLKESLAEVTKLKTELDAYKVRENFAGQKAKARQLCKDSQLPDVVVTEHFIDTLAGKDEAAMKLDIADRKKVIQVRESRPISPAGGDKPRGLDDFVKTLLTGQA